MKSSTIVAILLVLIGVLMGWYWWSQNGGPAMPGFGPMPQACTMEAMVCPDGSSVARTGPNCAFAPCPSPTTQTQPAVQTGAGATVQTGTAAEDPGLGDSSVPGQQ